MRARELFNTWAMETERAKKKKKHYKTSNLNCFIFTEGTVYKYMFIAQP